MMESGSLGLEVNTLSHRAILATRLTLLCSPPGNELRARPYSPMLWLQACATTSNTKVSNFKPRLSNTQQSRHWILGHLKLKKPNVEIWVNFIISYKIEFFQQMENLEVVRDKIIMARLTAQLDYALVLWERAILRNLELQWLQWPVKELHMKSWR